MINLLALMNTSDRAVESNSCAPSPSLQLFDDDYIERLVKKDPVTETHFCAYFGPLILMKLRARLRLPCHAEDLRQDTLLRVLNVLRLSGGLRISGSLPSFVNSVCNNVLLEFYRSEARMRGVPIDGLEPRDTRAHAEEALITEEQNRHILAVLEELPEKDRTLLRMLFCENLDKDRICERLRVDRQYLRVLIHRAKVRFREAIEKGEPAVPQPRVARGPGLDLVS